MAHVSLRQHGWGSLVVRQILAQTLEEAMCLAQKHYPKLQLCETCGHHSDDKHESEMLNILSLRNDICSKEHSSYPVGIQIKKAGTLGLRLKRFNLFIHI